MSSTIDESLRDQLCKEIKDMIWEKTKRKDSAGKNAFITMHSVNKVWNSGKRLERFFQGSSEAFIQKVRKNLLKVLSILVRMGWRDWSKFNDVFVNREDRFDEKLPFVNIGGWEDRPFSKPDAQDFDSFQYIFLPITIVENEDQEYAPSFRMPFVNVSRSIMKGSYSAVFPEAVASRQYQKRGESPDANVSELSCHELDQRTRSNCG